MGKDLKIIFKILWQTAEQDYKVVADSLIYFISSHMCTIHVLVGRHWTLCESDRVVQKVIYIYGFDQILVLIYCLSTVTIINPIQTVLFLVFWEPGWGGKCPRSQKYIGHMAMEFFQVDGIPTK